MRHGLGLLLMTVGLAGCAGGVVDQPPDVSLVDVRPVAAGLFEQRIAITFRITNPNDAQLPVDGYRFAIELNGQPFAKGASNRSVTVPRLSDATAEAEASVATSDLVRHLTRVPGSGAMTYRLSGTVFVDSPTGRRSMPFEQNGNLDFLSPEP